MPLIEAHEIHKVFGRRPERAVERLRRGEDREALRADGYTAAVIDASFEVEQGQIFVVMGLSGSGKSTLIRMVNGLLAPTAGRIEVAGRSVADLGSAGLRQLRREQVSMVFQHFALLPHRTVGENAAYGLKVQGLNRADRQRRAEEALELVGLGGWGGSLPGELSGGMRQRVGLARALAAGTEVLLMDEAFSALDPLIRREMQDQLVELQHRLDKTILFITHDLNEAMRLGDRVAMMRDGRIVQVGTAEEILNDPANDYVAQFVQDVDRTRVLTASSVMEPPVAVLGRSQGPRAAHKLMREHQVGSLMVVDRDRRLHGVVTEDDAADAVRRGVDDLADVTRPAVSTGPDTAVADLFAAAADSPVPIAVIGDGDRLLGVIPRVTLLSALGAGTSSEVVNVPPEPDDPSSTEPVEVGA
ncbi:glycine betaine/L-proline ABC transporter ATP-binding protein [Nocardioides sp. YIM 152315]|uniref:quaternary amine ABC transporter ATP-binding protein n=1 Tax=Nocardioides sp. YIM 152315 TaxID=3031760 RepID=UPI0023DADBA8|nr:glycine betaine/L-proline ABC transporter ATP-binding protein [Nocardioides sp. YIM 152315]MDF1602869.1 glycine betaine/L-proline ABC transporter ATP-binding protein [Nocardioides sp. YIM 152315]